MRLYYLTYIDYRSMETSFTVSVFSSRLFLLFRPVESFSFLRFEASPCNPGEDCSFDKFAFCEVLGLSISHSTLPRRFSIFIRDDKSSLFVLDDTSVRFTRTLSSHVTSFRTASPSEDQSSRWKFQKPRVKAFRCSLLSLASLSACCRQKIFQATLSSAAERMLGRFPVLRDSSQILSKVARLKLWCVVLTHKFVLKFAETLLRYFFLINLSREEPGVCSAIGPSGRHALP
jgi:hypothetical protein